VSWLQRVDGVLLAAPGGAEALLGVKPLSEAELPTEEKAGSKVLEASNVYLKGGKDLARPLADMQSNADVALASVDAGERHMYLVTAPLKGTDLKLGVLLGSPLGDALEQQRSRRGTGIAGLLLALLAALVVAAVLVLITSNIAARRTTVPIAMLTQKLGEIESTGRKHPVALAGDGEVAQLSRVIQKLVDKL
jgi:hypothetical protein